MLGDGARLRARIAELESEVARLHSGVSDEESPAALMRRLIEDAPVGVALMDTDLRYKMVNQKLAAMNGLPSSAHLGRTLEEIVPQSADEARKALQQVIATGEPLLGLEFSARANGTVRHWSKSLFPVRAESGKLLGVGGLVTETTDQNRVLDEAHLRRQQLELAQAAAGIGSWEWDLLTDELHCSPQCVSLYGLPRNWNLTYQQWLDCLHPEDRDWIVPEFRRVLAESNELRWEFRAVWPDGTVRWIWSRGIVNRDPDGKPTCVFGIDMDITDRKHAEQATRENEHRFRSMADAAPVMICAFDPAGRGVFFNSGWLNFTGRALDQELGEGWVEGVHPEDRERTLAELAASLELRSYCQAEYRLRRSDGEYRWILCHGTPRYGVDGEFTGYVASSLEITRLKLSHEAELVRQKMASVGVVVGGVAHDVKNLLNGVLMQSELLESDLPAGSPLGKGLSTVRLLAARAAEIAQELLAYAANETADFETVDLSKLVRDMMELTKASISKRATLDVQISDPAPMRGNPSQLRQVVLNLVTNASEALGGGSGTIRLIAAYAHISAAVGSEFAPRLAAGEYVRLEVSDSGVGIAEETRSRIFEPFFTTKMKGRGMGLALVQGIVLGHGGGIRVTSSPGRGTWFEVLLPAYGDPRRAPNQ